jgi:hypothetical protein
LKVRLSWIYLSYYFAKPVLSTILIFIKKMVVVKWFPVENGAYFLPTDL